MSSPYADHSAFTCTFCERVTPEDCLKTIEYHPEGSFAQEIQVCLACCWEAINDDPDHCRLVVKGKKE